MCLRFLKKGFDEYMDRVCIFVWYKFDVIETFVFEKVENELIADECELAVVDFEMDEGL